HAHHSHLHALPTRRSSDLAAFANPESLSEHALYGIGLVLGVYKALHTLFPDPVQADGWIRRPNSAPMFDGRRALDVMLSGNDQLDRKSTRLNSSHVKISYA